MPPVKTGPTPAPSTELALAGTVETLRLAQSEYAEAHRALSAIRDRTEGRIEATTNYLSDGPMNPGLTNTRLPPAKTYQYDPDDILEAKLELPVADVRFQRAALQLRRATKAHEAALQAAQRARLAHARPAFLAEFRALLAELAPLAERYQAFVTKGDALMADCPGAESFVRSMALVALDVAATELPDRQRWLQQEQNGGH